MMKTRTKALRTLYSGALLALAVLIVSGGQGSLVEAQTEGRTLWGTWYVAVDSTPFGIPGGVLPAVMTIHRDGTLTVTDAGDLGPFPFASTDTTQQGTWTQTGHQSFQLTTLFLRKDAVSGELEGWHRIITTLELAEDADHLVGFADEEVLPCDPAGPTPFKLLNCPNPITTAFSPSPFPIPLEMFRLRVVEAN